MHAAEGQPPPAVYRHSCTPLGGDRFLVAGGYTFAPSIVRGGVAIKFQPRRPRNCVCAMAWSFVRHRRDDVPSPTASARWRAFSLVASTQVRGARRRGTVRSAPTSCVS